MRSPPLLLPEPQKWQLGFGLFVSCSVTHSVISDSAIPWTAARQAYLSFTISQSLLRLMSTESMMTSNHLILCHTLLLPSIFPSFRVFSNESALRIRWPKYWSFASASVLPIQDWFPLGLTGLTSLKSKGPSSLLQHQSSKASILQHSTFFMVQLSHPFMTTGETISLTRQAFVFKVMSLLFSTLSLS